MAPTSAAMRREMERSAVDASNVEMSMMLFPIVCATAVPKMKGPMNSHDRRHDQGLSCREGPCGNDRCHHVGGIVKAVGVVKNKRQDDNGDDIGQDWNFDERPPVRKIMY